MLIQHDGVIQFSFNSFINPFQPSFAFHIETTYLVCFAKQMTGFYMEFNTG